MTEATEFVYKRTSRGLVLDPITVQVQPPTKIIHEVDEVKFLNQNPDSIGPPIETPRSYVGLEASTQMPLGNTYTLQLPIEQGNVGEVLENDGTGQLEWQPGGGVGDVIYTGINPVPTTRQFAVYDGVEGKKILDSGYTAPAAGSGVVGDVLTLTGPTDSVWSPPVSSGTVTSVSTTATVIDGVSLTATPNPITGSGSISLGGSVAVDNSNWIPAGADLAIANGGSGQSTAQLAIDALTDVASAGAGDVLTKSGLNATWAAPATDPNAVLSTLPFAVDERLIRSDGTGRNVKAGANAVLRDTPTVRITIPEVYCTDTLFAGNLGVGVAGNGIWAFSGDLDLIVTPGQVVTVNTKLETPVIKISTGAGAGKVLTSDASGDATWETGGDVTSSTNPSVNNTAVVYDSTTGKIIKEGGVVTISGDEIATTVPGFAARLNLSAGTGGGGSYGGINMNYVTSVAPPGGAAYVGIVTLGPDTGALMKIPIPSFTPGTLIGMNILNNNPSTVAASFTVPTNTGAPPSPSAFGIPSANWYVTFTVPSTLLVKISCQTFYAKGTGGAQPYYAYANLSSAYPAFTPLAGGGANGFLAFQMDESDDDGALFSWLLNATTLGWAANSIQTVYIGFSTTSSTTDLEIEWGGDGTGAGGYIDARPPTIIRADAIPAFVNILP